MTRADTQRLIDGELFYRILFQPPYRVCAFEMV
jgi:hypothetical protein